MRTRLSLYELQKVYLKKYKKDLVKDSKYAGLEACRKNVIKCNTSKKLCYCKGGV